MVLLLDGQLGQQKELIHNINYSSNCVMRDHIHTSKVRDRNR